MMGLRTELKYPIQKRTETMEGGVTSESSIVVRTYHVKKGNQQKRNAPMMIPRVLEALLSLCIRSR